MTKDVLVTVSGVQMDIEDTPIELVVPGMYYLKNGKHYVLYEEQAEADAPVVKNVVKFYAGHFEITKKGGVNTFLMFDKGKKTSTIYSTVMGPLQIDVMTEDVVIAEREDAIQVHVKYSLDINYGFVSECEVRFEVRACESCAPLETT